MTSVYFKKISFLISLTFLIFSAESFAKTTHCLVVRGKGVFYDPKIAEGSYILASEPLKGNCKYFDTWDDLYLDFSKNKEKYTENDQFFIDQAVHGMPGGRAFDCPGPKADGKEAKTPDDVGGTSPSKIIGILEEIAVQHQVLFLNQSCHGGSLLTRYLQHLDSSEKVNETQSRLCIMTDSVQGMVSHGTIDQFKSFAISERKNMPLSKAGSFDIFLSILFAKRVKSFKLVA